jgi:methylphosphotriester-DNA--protein-cysteine methyltransferase
MEKNVGGVNLNKQYRLIGADGKEYLSDVPGKFGGNKSTHIYGRLDCSIALAYIPRGYAENRVFFANEQDARAAGYRPCANCMRSEYNIWKNDQLHKTTK